MAGRTSYCQPSGRLQSRSSSVKRTGSFFSHFFCFWARSLMLELLSWAVRIGEGIREMDGAHEVDFPNSPCFDDTHEPELTQTCRVQTHSLGSRTVLRGETGRR